MSLDAHILLLEDDLELLETMTELLEESQYRVTPVASGLEAVKAASKRQFDLMIADIRMSGMSGLEAAEYSVKCQSVMKTLFVTGYATPENVARAEALQASSIITKPFEGQVLLERVAALLQQGQKEKAHAIRQQQQSRSLSWALESLALAIDLPQQDIPARRFRDLAVQMSLQLGLPAGVAREIGLGAALAAVDGLIQIPDEFLSDRSSLSTLRYCLSTFQDLDSSLESQLVLFVLAKLREEEDTLEEIYRLSPELEQAYNAIQKRPSKRPLGLSESSTEDSSSLLSLGQAFERLGDLEAAKQAYQQAQSEASPRVSCQGFLEQARLEVFQGKRREVIELCKKAANLAAQLGPQDRALTLFRCATLTSRAGMDSTLLLKKALSLLQPLKFEGTSALAWIALAAQKKGEDKPGPELLQHLRVLATPRYAEELSQSSDWLIPALLGFVEQVATTDFAAEVLRFLRNLPQKTVGHLDSTASNAFRSAKLLLLQALEEDPKLTPPTGFLLTLTKNSDSEVAQKASAILSQKDRSGEALTIRCSFLGPFTVYRGAEALPEKRWKTKKVKYLFSYLAFHWGKRLSSDAVCELFWPDKDPKKSRQSFYWYNSMIRKCLSEDEPGLKELLQRKDDTVYLDPEVTHWRDIDEFEGCLQDGRLALDQSSFEEAHRLFSQGLDLYRGPFLQGYSGDWTESRREHFRLSYERALASFAFCSFKLDRLAEAEEAANKLLDRDPANEKASEVLIHCLVKRGQAAHAIAEYDRCSEALRREFGLQPGDALEKAYQVALSSQ